MSAEMITVTYWGSDEEEAKRLLPPGTLIAEGAAKFEDEAQYRAWKSRAGKVGTMIVEHDKKTIAVLTFKTADGRTFVHKDDGLGIGLTEYDVHFQYTEGNYGCDCNRAIFINREHGTNYPEDCGDSIELIDTQITFEEVDWQPKHDPLNN